MAVTFESMDRRMPKIEKCLAEYGIATLYNGTHLLFLGMSSILSAPKREMSKTT